MRLELRTDLACYTELRGYWLYTVGGATDSLTPKVI